MSSLSEGDLVRAMGDARLAVELDPTDATHTAVRGAVLHAQGATSLALRDYEQALALDPTEHHALEGKGLILLERGQVAEAVQVFTAGVEGPWFPDKFRLLRAEARMVEANYRLAKKDIEHVIELDESRVGAHVRRVELETLLGDLEEAAALADDLVARFPEEPGAYAARGSTQAHRAVQEEELDTGLLDIALQDFAEAADLASDRPADQADYLVAHGDVLLDLERWDDAVASYDRALDLVPDHHEATWSRGLALGASDRQDEARAGCDRAIRLDPDLAEGY